MGKKRQLVEAGQQVYIKKYRSWGICEVVKVHKWGRRTRYTVSPMGMPGYTRYIGLKKNELEIIEK